MMKKAFPISTKECDQIIREQEIEQAVLLTCFCYVLYKNEQRICRETNEIKKKQTFFQQILHTRFHPNCTTKFLRLLQKTFNNAK